jgi:hypothetical protein
MSKQIMEQNNENSGKVLDRESSEDRRGRKSNRNNVIGLLIGFFLITVTAVIVIGFLYFGESDYEKGLKYYKDKKFTEAMYEFQKVGPDDKNFSEAQSSINYIKGLQAFNEGNEKEAMILLAKVRSDDQYYRDAVLMIEKYDQASIGNDLQSQIDAMGNKKDTVFVQKEYTGTTRKEADPVDPELLRDKELSRKYISEVSNSISKFENLYQSARTAPLTNKSDYSKSLESAHKQFNSLKYTANNKDAGVMELSRLTGDWMNKRIAFIRQLLIDKTVSETSTSASIKEQGDRLYSSVITQLNKMKKNI